MGTGASLKEPSESHKVPYKLINIEEEKKFVFQDEVIVEKMSPTLSKFYNDKPGNPGTWDELHTKVTSLVPINFSGLQIIKKRKLSEHFSATQSLILSSHVPTGCRFGASYQGDKIGPNECNPILKCEIMPNGNMTSTYTHYIGCYYRFKINTQLEKKEYKKFSVGFDYRTDDFTVSTEFSNVNIFKNFGLFKLQFLQALSPRIAVGAEISCWRDANYPSKYGNQTNMSGALRYSNGRQTICGVLSEDGMQVSYHHVASNDLQLGVQFGTDLRTHKSEASIVYKLNIPRMDATFYGLVKSESSVGALLEKELLPIPGAKLRLSAFLNHKKQNLLVGIGLNID